MFGYVKPLLCPKKPQIQQVYRACYCGLCRAMRRRHGQASTLFLQYDIVFLALLLDAVYEQDSGQRPCWCLHRCAERGKTYVAANASLYYAADVNVVLAYHKCRDDWADERKIAGLLGAWLLRGSVRRVERERPALAQVVRARLGELHVLEAAGSSGRADPAPTDEWADPFACLLADVAVLAPGVVEKEVAPLRWLFYNLGRWIYLIDAWEDRKRDSSRFSVLSSQRVCNPFLDEGVTREDAAFLLYGSLAEAGKALALLPLRRNADLLENIILEGCYAMTEKVLGNAECRVQSAE